MPSEDVRELTYANMISLWQTMLDYHPEPHVHVVHPNALVKGGLWLCADCLEPVDVGEGLTNVRG